ncbi:MAG: hypothetical protein ACFFAO_09310 [Candidatus Hermodarchaeota archaeon]
MNAEILKSLLDISNRQILFNKILEDFQDYGNLDYINYRTFPTKDGLIPFLTIPDVKEINEVKYVKVFVAAQHNEYNGLFGILKFFKYLKLQKLNKKDLIKENQLLIFLPLMNPYGFLHPSQQNKSGYYLKNGSNLNRFWRNVFAPEHQNCKEDLNGYPIPEQALVVKKILEKYWEKESIKIYFLDFHETSLLYRHLTDLSLKLNIESINYKFDHWLKERIVQNIMKLSDIKYYKESLFFKCKSNPNHTHTRLSIKQIDTIYEKLQQYIVNNQGKLPFYFCYSERSKKYCLKLANNVYSKLSDILWETSYPAVDHFHDHGCLVMMNDATNRPNIYSMELENQKHFFDIFEEIDKSNTDPNYFSEKLKSINISIDLVVETIIEMINLF